MIEISLAKGLEARGRYTFQWNGEPISIGRDADAHIRVSGLPLLRFRSEILLGPNGYIVRECSPGRSLRVNQRVVNEYGPLRQGDMIEIGAWVLRVTRTLRPSESSDPKCVLSEVIDSQSTAGLETLKTNNVDSPVSLTEGVNFLRTSLDRLQRNWTLMSEVEIREECWSILRSDDSPIVDIDNANHDLGKRVISEVIGLGPLEAYLQDPDISEVMVNGPADIFVERNGLLHRTEGRFSDEQSLRRVIERIFAPTTRRIDDSTPMADARLADGSRVNAVLSPPSVNGASLTIRRFSKSRLSSSDILKSESANQDMLDFLRDGVESKKSIIVSGGTGSGKTTFLRYLASLIPDDERLITIEDAAELNLAHPNLVSLEVRSQNQEGQGAITIRDLVKNALRMRPDRILIGEVRGGEALDLLQAMNTGHEGSLTTLHANSPRDSLVRLEVMAMMSGYDIPILALREQISSAVDLIVQMSRDNSGRRFVSAISRIEGIDSGRIQLEPLFGWNRETGAFMSMGLSV